MKELPNTQPGRLNYFFTVMCGMSLREVANYLSDPVFADPETPVLYRSLQKHFTSELPKIKPAILEKYRKLIEFKGGNFDWIKTGRGNPWKEKETLSSEAAKIAMLQKDLDAVLKERDEYMRIVARDSASLLLEFENFQEKAEKLRSLISAYEQFLVYKGFSLEEVRKKFLEK